MPDPSTPYLEDVPGVKDVRLRGGSLLPRRNVFEIDGARVWDDAAGAQTRIELGMPHNERRVVFADFPAATASLFVCDNSDADAYRFVDVTGLAGLAPPPAGGRYRVWIFNMDGATAMDVLNQSGSAPVTSRIVTISGSSLSVAANGGMCLLLYSASRWRQIG